MTEKEIKGKIDNNRDKINNYLMSELPLDIIYFNIRILSKVNLRLILKIKQLKHSEKSKNTGNSLKKQN